MLINKNKQLTSMLYAGYAVYCHILYQIADATTHEKAGNADKRKERNEKGRKKASEHSMQALCLTFLLKLNILIFLNKKEGQLTHWLPLQNCLFINDQHLFYIFTWIDYISRRILCSMIGQFWILEVITNKLAKIDNILYLCQV